MASDGNNSCGRDGPSDSTSLPTLTLTQRSIDLNNLQIEVLQKIHMLNKVLDNKTVLYNEMKRLLEEAKQKLENAVIEAANYKNQLHEANKKLENAVNEAADYKEKFEELHRATEAWIAERGEVLSK